MLPLLLVLQCVLIGLVWTLRPKPKPAPHPEILEIVKLACADAGIDPAKCEPAFDLHRTGKLGDVLFFATDRLSHVPVKSVHDLVTLLELYS